MSLASDVINRHVSSQWCHKWVCLWSVSLDSDFTSGCVSVSYVMSGCVSGP